MDCAFNSKGRPIPTKANTQEKGTDLFIGKQLDWLWFLGCDLDTDIPNHSVLSKARKRGVLICRAFFRTHSMAVCRSRSGQRQEDIFGFPWHRCCCKGCFSLWRDHCEYNIPVRCIMLIEGMSERLSLIKDDGDRKEFLRKELSQRGSR